MNVTLDPNLYKQIGLDSGSLTMLGTIVHNLPEVGEYRGVLHRGREIESTFSITVDKASSAAQVNIDLSRLVETAKQKEDCSTGPQETANHFVVNPKGYVVLHVSGGSGGYYVIIEKAEDKQRTKPFDSRQLKEGDLFAAIMLRPGTYSVANQKTNAKGQLVVEYPVVGKFLAKASAKTLSPIRVDCTSEKFEPNHVEIQPGHGLVFQPKVPSRIKIELLKADDGPEKPAIPVRDGWRKPVIVKRQSKRLAKTT